MDFLGERAERVTCSAPIIMVVVPVGVFIRNTGVCRTVGPTSCFAWYMTTRTDSHFSYDA